MPLLSLSLALSLSLSLSLTLSLSVSLIGLTMAMLGVDDAFQVSSNVLVSQTCVHHKSYQH